MKLKLYLRGLGAGIIVTTIMLSFAFHVKNNSESLPASTQATQAISQTSASRTTEAQTKEETKATQAETQTTQAETKATQAETKATQAETNATQAETQATQVQTPVSVVFDNISSSEQAAQIIAQAGIIADWRDFNSYLISNGYAASIHNGVYSLHAGQDYESIAKTITGKK